MLRFAQEFDLLGHWSDRTTQKNNPRIYLVVRSTMAYMASTAFVKSVFSIAGRLLMPVMSNYGEKTLEAMVMLKIKVHVEKRMTKVKAKVELSDDETDDEFDRDLGFQHNTESQE